MIEKRENLQTLTTKMGIIEEQVKQEGRQIRPEFLKVYKEDLLEVAKTLDNLYKTEIHTNTVKNNFFLYKQPKKAVVASIIHLNHFIKGYRDSLVEQEEKILSDGVYYRVREDEVVAVEEGKVVWKDGYFREEYGLATSEELARVIAEVKALQEEIQ